MPLVRGLTPFTAWNQRGRYIIITYKPPYDNTLVAAAQDTIGLRKRSSGNMLKGPRWCSHNRKEQNANNAPQKRLMIVGEPHEYDDPPQSTAKRSITTDPEKSAHPGRSSRFSCCRTESRVCFCSSFALGMRMSARLMPVIAPIGPFR